MRITLSLSFAIMRFATTAARALTLRPPFVRLVGQFPEPL
jgi:hypothetical protein